MNLVLIGFYEIVGGKCDRWEPKIEISRYFGIEIRMTYLNPTYLVIVESERVEESEGDIQCVGLDSWGQKSL